MSTPPNLERTILPHYKQWQAHKAASASPSCSLEQRSHKVEKGERILQHFLTKP